MSREEDDRFSTGRPAKDEQMKALQRMLATPSRQWDELPKIGERSLEPEPKTVEED